MYGPKLLTQVQVQRPNIAGTGTVLVERFKHARGRAQDACPVRGSNSDASSARHVPKAALLNNHGLTSHQSINLLERLGWIIEMGQRVAKGTTR